MSGLLLVAVSYARLGGNGEFGYGYPRGDAPLLAPITDPGTRGGAILAVILTTVPVALLLDQCVRLGTTAQRRRYEALGVAGATRADLRRWGAVETGVPALLGALLGIGVWLLLRLFLGTGLADSGRGGLVPTVTGPGWWTLLVVGLVAAYGVLVGARAAGRATAAIRREAGPPRPWGLLLVVFAVVALPFAFSDTSSDLLLYAAVAAAPLGIMSAAPSLAYVMSGRVTRRTDQAAVLLAARRIRADHGATGRAAAAVGGVGLTLGVAGELVADLLSAPDQYDLGYYLVPALLVGGLALLAVGMIAFSLTLHSIEATLSRRRAMSALVATGVPTDTLEEATRAEGRLVTLPLAVVSASLGALVAQVVLADHAAALLGGLVAVVVTVGSVLLAVRVAARAARPWLREAVAVGNLRTE